MGIDLYDAVDLNWKISGEASKLSKDLMSTGGQVRQTLAVGLHNAALLAAKDIRAGKMPRQRLTPTQKSQGVTLEMLPQLHGIVISCMRDHLVQIKEWHAHESSLLNEIDPED